LRESGKNHGYWESSIKSNLWLRKKESYEVLSLDKTLGELEI